MKNKMTFEQANKVLLKIAKGAMDKEINIEKIMDGCVSGQHRFGSDGICRGCGRHQALVQKK